MGIRPDWGQGRCHERMRASAWCHSSSADGVLRVANTEKRRRQDISEQIKAVVTTGSITSHEAASLKGRLGFAEGQLFLEE